MAVVSKSVTFKRRARRGEQGYILLILMLIVAVMAIGAVSMIDNFQFEAKRDQEEELIHRGVQYSRAVRKYVKKFGTYPNRLEDLENTNNIRFLRKRYKDPITGKDFKLLHLGDVQLGAGATLAGATSAAQLAAGANAQGVGGAQSLIAAQGIAGLAAQGQQPLNQNSGASSASPDGAQSGDDKDSSSNQPFSGGGPIVGVASLSKKKSIREFNKKNHYNQWQFIYDPSTDTGGLLNTPAQPPLQVTAPNVNGRPGTTGQPGSFGGQLGSGGQLGPGGLPIQSPQPQQPSQPPN